MTDPDLIGGSLGNLRSLFGFGKDDDQVNTVEDEQDLTNFRIVSDYVTSLAQSWLNNLQFFGLQTQTPFFGTQLVLLTRQLSVIAESVNEVRFTLDYVFIAPPNGRRSKFNSRPAIRPCSSKTSSPGSTALPPKRGRGSSRMEASLLWASLSCQSGRNCKSSLQAP